MEKDVIMWLIGLLLVPIIGGVAWLMSEVIKHGRLLERIDEHLGNTDKNVARMEGHIAYTSKAAAKILYSPHTPLLDPLLEKYWNSTLTLAEAESLIQMCKGIEDDKKVPREERTLACGTMVGVCKAFNLPLPEFHAH